MAKESVLTPDERKQIHIEKIIFHVIISEQFKPTYLDELILTEPQREFFKNRLDDASYGRQFLFNDPSTSEVFEKCKMIIDDPEANFINCSKKLAAGFKKHHKSQMNDGVFVVALVKIQNKKLIFLVKIDHKKVYQYIVEDKAKTKSAIMHEISNTFVEDKKAIQKVAIIDIENHFKWDVLASDRNMDGIREYFRDYLDVVEREDASALTRKALTVTRQWAIENNDILPEYQDISTYKDRAYQYLHTHPKFKTDAYAEMVTHDEDEETRLRLRSSFLNYLCEVGLSGQEFNIKPKSLKRNDTKNVRKTDEGVKIEWDGDARQKMINLPKERDEDDDLYHILIKTANIEILN